MVRNKPVVNEILLEQDKLKQYELVTATYKERLEKEKQRIQEMEVSNKVFIFVEFYNQSLLMRFVFLFQQEKEEREREISKLKQQVKLIDLFTNGPEVKKSESKIPRRHTMGHYTSRIPLQTIPESKLLSSNVMPVNRFSHTLKNDLDNEKCKYFHICFTLSIF